MVYLDGTNKYPSDEVCNQTQSPMIVSLTVLFHAGVEGFTTFLFKKKYFEMDGFSCSSKILASLLDVRMCDVSMD
jgi:hypothetical protein